MAGSFVTTGTYAPCEKILKHIFKITAWTPPATLYLALFTADPTDAGTITSEATYTNYARQTIAFAAASGRTITQDGTVYFPVCGTTGKTVSHWGIMASDVTSADNMIAHGAFAAPKVITTNYGPYVASGEIAITLDSDVGGGISTDYATPVLDFVFRAVALTAPTNIYVSLHSTACSDSAAGTELSGNNYSRLLCSNWEFVAPLNPSVVHNTAVPTVQALGGAWSTAVAAGIYDADTSGNYLFWVDITDITVAENDYARVPEDQLAVQLT